MTALPHPAQVSPGPSADTKRRSDEFRVLGHLLGRKDSLQGIAHGAGLSLDLAQALCEELCAQGKLSASGNGPERRYRVSSGQRQR